MLQNLIRRVLFILLLVTGLSLVACGSGAETVDVPEAATEQPTDVPATDTPQPEPTEEPAATPEPATNAVQALESVKSAVIQIEAQGSFVDPEVGLQLNAAGSGTGFIIDESGIAVTNNHVVTGAAFLRVFVGGDTQTTYNAQVLGVSECSDLAVIDIEGGGFPYLEWYQGNMNVGLDVYAAGFPLGDPEFTLTRGIISKEQADGETSWASVDSVIEHDATINPGNSGGPLVTTDGQVLAVNYAGASSVNQYFAIARTEALELIEQLQQGEDVTSIGVNGTAVNDGAGLSGIWVSSVKSGSPADAAGIEPGDIITSLEGFVLATDGTMADYCDILRSHAPTDVLDIEVLRFQTEEVLAGQLNGDVLETRYSFAAALEEEVEAQGIDEGAAVYESYTTITDDTGTLSVEVPTAWSQTDGSLWLLDGETIGVSVVAAANVDNFLNSWTESGVRFRASSTDTILELTGASSITTEEFLDIFDWSESCTFDSRVEYTDPLYTGSYDLWTDCGGEDVLYLVLSATPEGGEFLILVEVQIYTDADIDALQHIFDSFIATSQ